MGPGRRRGTPTGLSCSLQPPASGVRGSGWASQPGWGVPAARQSPRFNGRYRSAAETWQGPCRLFTEPPEVRARRKELPVSCWGPAVCVGSRWWVLCAGHMNVSLGFLTSLVQGPERKVCQGGASQKGCGGRWARGHRLGFWKALPASSVVSAPGTPKGR